MKYSIIIPVHNRIELITHLLDSLNGTEGEVVFMVNGVCDSAIFNTLNNFKKNNNAIIIKAESALSYSTACNIAVKEATGKYVILMNSDVLVTQESINILLKTISRNKQIGAVQGLLLYPQNHSIQSAGHVFNEYNNYHALKGNTQRLNFAPRLRQALTTAYCCVPKELYNHLGGMDEFYYNAYDGMELSVRISKAGYKCYCVSEAKGYHFQGMTRNINTLLDKPDTGKFWSDHGDFLHDDIYDEIKEQITMFGSTFQQIINVSNIRDIDFFSNQIVGSKLSSTDLTDRYCANVIIANNLSHSFLQTRDRIIWVTTHFSQLANNIKTFEDYTRNNDIIIDLSSNVISVNALLK